jgi:hypothetical protein
MIGRLFDKFVEWTLNRQDQYYKDKTKRKAPTRKRTSRVRRRANAKKK